MKLFGEISSTNFFVLKEQEISKLILFNLENGKTEIEIKSALKDRFILGNIILKKEIETVRDLNRGFKKYIGGRARLLTRYEYTIPFDPQTEGNLFTITPPTFHGTRFLSFNLNGNNIVGYFESEMGNQGSFSNFKSECFGDLASNIIELNKEVKKWNDRLGSTIDRIYLTTFQKFNSENEFKKRIR